MINLVSFEKRYCEIRLTLIKTTQTIKIRRVVDYVHKLKLCFDVMKNPA